MYSYILFDLDGTLTDPREGITKSVQYALSKMGIEESDLDNLLHFIGPPLFSEFKTNYGFSDIDAHRAVAFYRERFQDVGWRENLLFDGVPALLGALQKCGKHLAIASSKPAVFVEKILELFAIEQYFEAVSGATMDGKISAKFDVVENAIEMLGAERSDCVLVGDRLHDIEGAHQAGISCIGVTFGFGGREELEAYGADAIANTWDELLALLHAGEENV